MTRSGLAAEDVGETAAEDVGSSAVKDAAETCGGMSFTPGTKVLLASGTAVPISQLKVGEKVLATNTKTGKTQPEAVTAVLVHHDTDLYDLKIRAHGKTAVIDTTSNHLFWAPGTGGHSGLWGKAGSLKYGTHLRTATGGTATVVGGWAPKVTAGWMWDLTVPGNNDHDFYIDTEAADILVHNECSDELADVADENIGRTNVASEVTNENGASGFGASQARTLEDLTPQVRTAAQAVGHHMGCAEIGALCDLESQGEPLRGLSSTAVKVMGGSQEYGMEEHLEEIEACELCQGVLDFLDR